MPCKEEGTYGSWYVLLTDFEAQFLNLRQAEKCEEYKGTRYSCGLAEELAHLSVDLTRVPCRYYCSGTVLQELTSGVGWTKLGTSFCRIIIH